MLNAEPKNPLEESTKLSENPRVMEEKKTQTDKDNGPKKSLSKLLSVQLG